MINKKVLLLAGTTEGRRLAKALCEAKIQGVVSVATEYAQDLMQDEMKNLEIRSGRLGKDEMKKMIKEENIDLVIDATHPYAVIVTHNIKEVCEAEKIEYLRLVRLPSVQMPVNTFKRLEEVIAFLSGTEGAVLLTTGSKDLLAFTALEDFEQRLYPRILPMAETLQSALTMGYKRSHMICMQGPFSYELNVAMLKQLDIKYMVTKDSGDVGGLKDKLEAAKDTQVTVLLIARPEVEMGYTLEQLLSFIEGGKRCPNYTSLE